jgi:hypothetical protein
MRTILLFAAIALLSAPTLARKPEADGKKSDPNRVVCRKEEVIGSRLASKKTCMTVMQWDQLEREQRQSVDRIQAFKPQNGG